MNRNRLRDALVPHLGEDLPAAPPEIRFRCPRCVQRGRSTPDTSGHLFVNPEREKFNCFRCEWRGPLSHLLNVYHVESLASVKDWETVFRGLALFADKKVVEEKHDSTQEIGYPCPVVHPALLPEAWEYLTGKREDGFRGMSPEVVNYYGIVAAYEKPYLGRVFIPTYANGKVVFWVARTYCDQEPKYLNPKGVNKVYYLFGLEQAKRYDTVVITEGVFSAIAAGPNAVAAFGKAVSDEQKAQLLDAKFKNYVVALDGDARKEATNLAMWFASRGCNTFLVDMPVDKDPDEDLEFRNRVAAAKRFDFYSSVGGSLT